MLDRLAALPFFELLAGGAVALLVSGCVVAATAFGGLLFRSCWREEQRKQVEHDLWVISRRS